MGRERLLKKDEVIAAAKRLRERHGGNGYDLKIAQEYRDRSEGHKWFFWQCVCDYIDRTVRTE